MKRVRIGFKADIAVSERPTGVQHFAASVLDALLALSPADVHWYVFVPPGRTLPVALDRPAAVTVVQLPTMKAPLAWSSWRHRLDVLYTPGHSLPVACRGALVVTVYDVIFHEHPEWYSAEQAARLHKGIEAACRRAARVVTPSKATKDELVRVYGVSDDRIDVVGASHRPIFANHPDVALPERLITRGVRRPFFVVVGRLNRRKNLERIIDAYRLLLTRTGLKAHLVLAGPDHFGAETIQARLQQPAVAGEHIVTTGYITDEELAALYRHSVALVYPSLAEGFGLPIVEAMACRAPVITSNISVMREVAGDAALCVDPYSTDEIAAAMERVLTDATCANSLADAGEQRARQYSWHDTAARLLGALRAAADRR